MEVQQSISETVVGFMKESCAFSRVTAEIRAEVYHLLTKDAQRDRSVPLCRENFVINELIREYLLFSGLSHTLSVFVPETGQPNDPMNRDFLAHMLSITPKRQTPLLNSIIQKNRPSPDDQSPARQPRPPPKPPSPRLVPPTPAFHDDISDDDSGYFEIKS
jgi:lisH domain-containing protein FOPNL